MFFIGKIPICINKEIFIKHRKNEFFTGYCSYSLVLNKVFKIIFLFINKQFTCQFQIIIRFRCIFPDTRGNWATDVK